MNSVTGNSVVHELERLLKSRQDIAGLLGITTISTDSFVDLAADVLAGLCQGNAHVREVVGRVYRDNPSLIALSEHDIAVIARRNFERGGVAATLLFARGVYAIMSHRVIHQLWCDGDSESPQVPSSHRSEP